MAQPVLSLNPAGPPPPSLPEQALPCVQALLQARGLGLAFLDEKLRFRFVNETVEALSGMSASAYMGRAVDEVWPEALATRLTPLLQQALAGEAVLGARVCGPLDAEKGAGQWLVVRVTILPASSSGLSTGVGLLLEDETPQARAEQALRESEERLRALTDVSCDGYLLHEGGFIFEASQSLSYLLGLTLEEMMGQPLTRWVAPESRDEVTTLLSQQTEIPCELSIVRLDGRRLFLEVMNWEVEHRGRPARMTAIWDVGARKVAEETHARADTFREQLLGVVGHDLRSPLYAIQLSVGALQRHGVLDEMQSRQVAHLASATRRMERMIHELMDYTRARLAGGLPLRPAPLDLDRLLEQVVKQFQHSHPTRLLVHLAEGPARGLWDEGLMGRLLDNLLGNALQHSPEDTPVEVRLVGASNHLTLSVHNEGPSVPLEERATLFEAFRRGKRAQGDGLGLGLYIVRQIFLAHRGRISVESGEGLGTRFTVWLPRESSDS